MEKIKNKLSDINRKLKIITLCLKDKDTSLIVKGIIWLVIAYGLSPIDLIPDFIPILGYLDDLIILPALIGLAIKLIDKDVYSKNEKLVLENDNSLLESKWYYSFVVIIIWLLVIKLIIKLIRGI